MQKPVLFLLGNLEMGGSELKFVRLANEFSRLGLPVCLAWFGGPETLLSQINDRVSVLRLGRRGRYSPRALYRLMGAVRHMRPATMVSVNEYPMLYSWPARALSRSNCRLVVSINTTDFKDARQARFMKLYKHLIRRMDSVVFGCKRQQYEWINGFGIPETLCTVIYNGVDLQRFSPPAKTDQRDARAGLGIPFDQPLLVCIAQLLPEKGHRYLFEAIAERENRKEHLLLVGDGPARPDLERLSISLGIEKRVSFLGEVPDVNRPLAAADVFVLPSVAVETFSNAALEASACGLPLIMTDLGGAREMVGSSEGAILVPPRDAQALRRAIDDVLTGEDARTRFGKHARARTEARFGFQKMVTAWRDTIWPAGSME